MKIFIREEDIRKLRQDKDFPAEDKFLIGGEKNPPVGGNFYHVCESYDGLRPLDSSMRLSLLDLADMAWREISDGSSMERVLYDYHDNKLYLVIDYSRFDDRDDFVGRYFNDELSSLSFDSEFRPDISVISVDEALGLGDVYDLYTNELVYESMRIGLAYESLSRFLNEEVVADGNSEHNPYAKHWKEERDAMKSFLEKYGKLMTSKENGKTYKVYYDETMSRLIGYDYCICLQYDPMLMKPGSTVYIRALDKFTERMFQANFDTRGKDNMSGTYDDTV